MMGLPGMHQDEVVAQGQQKRIQILPVAAGSFQPNADLCRDAVELGEGGGEACKARCRIRDREGGAHGGFVGAQDTNETGLAPHIDADDILERGTGASGGGRVSACHRAPPLLQGWSTTKHSGPARASHPHQNACVLIRDRGSRQRLAWQASRNKPNRHWLSWRAGRESTAVGHYAVGTSRGGDTPALPRCPAKYRLGVVSTSPFYYMRRSIA